MWVVGKHFFSLKLCVWVEREKERESRWLQGEEKLKFNSLLTLNETTKKLGIDVVRHKAHVWWMPKGKV